MSIMVCKLTIDDTSSTLSYYLGTTRVDLTSEADSAFIVEPDECGSVKITVTAQPDSESSTRLSYDDTNDELTYLPDSLGTENWVLNGCVASLFESLCDDKTLEIATVIDPSVSIGIVDSTLEF